jgi:hypothetical protein
VPTKITFNSDGTWTGGARIPPELQDMNDLSAWTKKFILKFNDIGRMYGRYFANDGNLIGQEKANLVSELDGLIGGLLLLRRYVTRDNPSEFEALPGKYGYSMGFKVDISLWYGKGKISNQVTFKMNGFVDWYNNIMMKKIKLIFQKYAAAMEDGVLSAEEQDDLCRFIETIIFDILVIEKLLIYSGIDR